MSRLWKIPCSKGPRLHNESVINWILWWKTRRLALTTVSHSLIRVRRWRWIEHVLRIYNIARIALSMLFFRLPSDIIAILCCSYKRSFSTFSFKNRTSSHLLTGKSKDIDWRAQSHLGRKEKRDTTFSPRYSLDTPRTHQVENNESNWK